MQTFLPYPSFIDSLKCLDDKRLGNQRKEAMQILDALKPGSTSRWKNHPAVKMWADCTSALKVYHDISIDVWISRGFKNTMLNVASFKDWRAVGLCGRPEWLGNKYLHASHRSNLLRKDPIFYGKYNWTEPHDIPYFWPV